MYGYQYTAHYYVNYRVTHNDDKNIVTELDIIEVFKLLDTSLGGFDGWPHKDTTKKSLVITPKNWKNIALIAISESKLPDLIGKGAELKNSKYIFDNLVDAKIQLAFIASKYNVSVFDIYELSRGILTPDAYEKLLDLFYNEFPEKFI